MASFSALGYSTRFSNLWFIKVLVTINLYWILNVFLLRNRLGWQFVRLWTDKRSLFSFAIDFLNHLEIRFLIELWRFRSLCKELISLNNLFLARPWLKLIPGKNTSSWILWTQIIQSCNLLLLPRWSKSVLQLRQQFSLSWLMLNFWTSGFLGLLNHLLLHHLLLFLL